MAAPKLPRAGTAGTRGSPGAAPSREAGAVVLTYLYAGVPGTQGTDNDHSPGTATVSSDSTARRHTADRVQRGR
jgi:hypothetical protein